MNEHIKINNKTGVLGNDVKIALENEKINVTVNIDFSKRYLKYLTKKFLKTQKLRDYIRVISTEKKVYFLKYYSTLSDKTKEKSSD